MDYQTLRLHSAEPPYYTSCYSAPLAVSYLAVGTVPLLTDVRHQSRLLKDLVLVCNDGDSVQSSLSYSTGNRLEGVGNTVISVYSLS
jgi:hypothetical protein